MMPQIKESLEMISAALEMCQRPYIAFSGGKDSLVVAHLVHRIDSSVEMVYCDDELLWPEHNDYMAEIKAMEGSRLRWVSGGGLHRGWFRPWSMAADNWWRDPPAEMEWLPFVDGQRGRLSRLAVQLGYDGAFLGMRRAESRRREAILDNSSGTEMLAGYLRVNPIIDWSDDDVWAYIGAENLTCCPVYDRLTAIGVSRHNARLGPLPLAQGEHLWKGWPELYVSLVQRYGLHWTRPGLRRPPSITPLLWLELKDALQRY